MYHFCPFPKEGGGPHLPSIGLTLRSLCSPTTCLPRFSLIYRRKLPALTIKAKASYLAFNEDRKQDRCPSGIQKQKTFL